MKWKNDIGSLNYNTSKNADYANSIIFNDKLYLFWRENNGIASQIKYKYYDYIKWSNDNIDSLNYDSSKDVRYKISNIIFNNKLYLFWNEKNGAVWQIRYKYYDGTKWYNSNELNYDSSKEAYKHYSIIYDDKLYIFWNEWNGVAGQIRYKYYDGIKWNDDNGASLNYNSNKAGNYPNSIVFNNKLYVFWSEYNENNIYQIRYKYYDGAKWHSDNSDLNYDINKTAYEPNSIIYNDKLYIFWSEYNKSEIYQIRYKYYDGSKWRNDDGSLNYDSSKDAYNLDISIYNKSLYVFWQERNETICQIRYKHYDDIKWNDDNSILNYDASRISYEPNSILFNSDLYLFWSENNGNNTLIRYKNLSTINYILLSNYKNYTYKNLLLQQTNSKDFQNIDSLDFLTEKQLTLEQDYDNIITTEDNKKIYNFKLKDKSYESILEGKCIESGGESDV